MGWLTNLFKKKYEPGRWFYIDYCEEAKQRSVGNDFVKRIYHMYNEYLVEVETFSQAKFNQLKRDKVPFVDLTQGYTVPRESTFKPSTYETLGKIQISRTY